MRDQEIEGEPRGAARLTVGAAPSWGGLRRPMLKPGLRRLQRDATTVQLGLDPERAVLVTGLDAAGQRWLARLDGSHERAGVLQAAQDAGVPADAAGTLIGALAASGLLDDAATSCPSWSALPGVERERLRPDLASLALVHRRPDGGRTALAGRLAATVEVRGAGRVGASVATLLAAAGIGRVLVVDHEPTHPADVAPAGLSTRDLGCARGVAAARAAAAAGVSVRPTLGDGGGPDLVVLAVEEPVPAAVRDALIAAHVPHLLAGVRETSGIVGPLVVPGKSSCLMCHDLARTDRDPGWPRLVAQLVAEPPAAAWRVRPCDAVLATTVAGHAVLQALAFLDGVMPSTVDGTLEIALPEGTVRRRSWQRHPACGCAWADETALANGVS